MTEKELHQIIHEILTSEQTLKESTRTPKRAVAQSRRLTEAAKLYVKDKSGDSLSVKRTKMLLNHLYALHIVNDYENYSTKTSQEYSDLAASLAEQLMKLPQGQKLIDMNNKIADSFEYRIVFVERTDAYKKLRDAAGIDDAMWVNMSTEKFKLYEPYGYEARPSRDDRQF